MAGYMSIATVGDDVLFLYPLGCVERKHPKGVALGVVAEVRIQDTREKCKVEYTVMVGDYTYRIDENQVVGKSFGELDLPSGCWRELHAQLHGETTLR
jgi:hypothetical protein